MNTIKQEVKTAQIGRCGELLVQYKLLLGGVESAPMTTDSGVDLVAYSPMNEKAITIQVKTNLKPKKSGSGKGKAALDWWISEKSPAHYIALVDLSSNKIWLLSHAEVSMLAQQKSSGRYHLYMYVDPTVKPLKAGRHSYEFEKFLLENRAHEVFQSRISN